MRLLVWLAPTFAAACVLTPGEWRNARDHAVCEVLVECFEAHPSVDTCVEGAGEDAEECALLRLGATWQCLRQLRRQVDDCPSSLETWQIPASCALVCQDEP